ncbi:MAG: ATP-binding protein [Rubrobacteraceae bacterium]
MHSPDQDPRLRHNQSNRENRVEKNDEAGAIYAGWKDGDGGAVRQPPDDFLQRLDADVESSGGELAPEADREGAIGATMFDLPNSEDGTLTVLLAKENLQSAPSQALVRVKSRDKRNYLGIVANGPFAEPDSLRGDSHMLVTVATRGGIYLPPYHGRVQVSILGEEQADGTLKPPRLRPLPNSPVFALDDSESAAVLRSEGDISLGMVAGYDEVPVGVPSTLKSVLPRHTAVLGTTGSGKSTTISGFVQQAQAADMAVVLLDVEGEYTFLHEPTEDPRMLSALKERGLEPRGIPEHRMTVYHLVGRDTANPDHPNRREFSLQFARLSPYTVIEILGLTEAQTERFLKAYDVAKEILRDLDIFPKRGDKDQERLAVEFDEFERGYPRLTLSIMMDVVGACLAKADKSEINPHGKRLSSDKGKEALVKRVKTTDLPGNAVSWRALLGRLARLNRLKVFDSPKESVQPINYKKLLRPGSVSIIDLSDSGMSELSNIVIADLLRGIQETQDASYEKFEKAREGAEISPPARVLTIIEEAHEFLSAERIDKMPILFEQVARVAKRGRKRGLGLVFVTQLPQHLPRQVFGLVNSYLLHKITDPQVVSNLKRTVSGIDDSLWRQVPGLAPGQAIAAFPHMTRPLLVAVDPSPAKLRLVD